MASTYVKSIRISPDLWAKVEAFAKWNESSENAAACVLINMGVKHLFPGTELEAIMPKGPAE